MKKPNLKSYVKINKDEAQRLKEKGREKSKSLMPKVLKIITVLVAAVIIISLALIGAKRFAGVSMSNVTDWFKGIVLKASPGEGFPYSIEGDVLVQSEIVGPYLALVEKEKLVFLNSHAKDIFKYEHTFVDPVLKTKNGRAVFYCEGSKEYVVTSSSELLYDTDKTADTLDGGIIIADVGSKGNLAFATWSDKYACKISVFDQKLNTVFYYGFSSGRVVDLSLSDDGKHVCAAVIDAENATIYTRLMVFDTSKSEPVCDIKLDSQSGVDIEFVSLNNIELVTLTSFFRFNYTSKNAPKKILDFSGNDLENVAFDSTKRSFSLAVKEFSLNYDTIFLLKSNSENHKTAQTDTVKAVSRSSKYTLCLTDHKIYCLKNRSGKGFEIELNTNVDNILANGSTMYVFTGNEIYKLGLSRFTKFEIN